MIWNFLKISNSHCLSLFLIFGPRGDKNGDKRNTLKLELSDISIFKNSSFLLPEDLTLNKNLAPTWVLSLEEQEKIMTHMSEFSFIFYDTTATVTESQFIKVNSFNNNYANLIPNSKKNNLPVSNYNKIVEKQEKLNTYIKYNADTKLINQKKNYTFISKNNTDFWKELTNRVVYNKTVLKISYMFLKVKNNDIKNPFFITYDIDNKNKIIKFYIPLRQYFNFIIAILNKNQLILQLTDELLFDQNKFDKFSKNIMNEINKININTLNFLKSKSSRKNFLTDLSDIFQNFSEYTISTNIIYDNKIWNYNLSVKIVKHLLSFLSKEKFPSVALLNNDLIIDNTRFLLKNELKNKIDELCKILNINSFSNVFFLKKKYWKTYKIKKENGKFRYIYTYKRDYLEYKEFHSFLDRYYDIFSKNNSFTKKLDYSYAYKKKTSIKQMLEKHSKSKAFFSFDIKDFFNSINHKILVKNISTFFEKKLSYELIKQYIKFCTTSNVGLNLGLTSSPLLSNIYLYKFDQEITKFLNNKKIFSNKSFIYTRYADDILISSSEKCNNEIFLKIKEKIILLLKKINLELNESKGKYIEDITKSNNFNNKFFGIILLWKKDKIDLKLPNFYFDKFIFNLLNNKIYSKNKEKYIRGKLAYSFLINKHQSFKYFSRIYKKEFNANNIEELIKEILLRTKK